MNSSGTDIIVNLRLRTLELIVHFVLKKMHFRGLHSRNTVVEYIYN